MPAPTHGFRPDALRTAREQAGLTQQQLADLLGIRDQAVYRWEHGRVTPTPATVGSIAAALGLAPADLLDHSPATLAELRERAGLTQGELAARVGLSQIAVSRLERGQADLDDQLAASLAAVLAVPVEQVAAAYERGRSA